MDFWAVWCNPCRMFSPVFEDCAEEMPEAKFVKVNVDEVSEIAAKYRIMSIPTVAVIKNGEIAAKSVGVISKEELKN